MKKFILSFFLVCFLGNFLFAGDDNVVLGEKILTDKKTGFLKEMAGSNSKNLFGVFSDNKNSDDFDASTAVKIVSFDKISLKKVSELSLKGFGLDEGAELTMKKLKFIKLKVVGDFLYVVWREKIPNKRVYYVQILSSDFKEVVKPKLVFGKVMGEEESLSDKIEVFTNSKLGNDIVVLLQKGGAKRDAQIVDYFKISRDGNSTEIVSVEMPFEQWGYEGNIYYKPAAKYFIGENASVYFKTELFDKSLGRLLFGVGCINLVNGKVSHLNIWSGDKEVTFISINQKHNKVFLAGTYILKVGKKDQLIGCFSGLVDFENSKIDNLIYNPYDTKIFDLSKEYKFVTKNIAFNNDSSITILTSAVIVNKANSNKHDYSALWSVNLNSKGEVINSNSILVETDVYDTDWMHHLAITKIEKSVVVFYRHLNINIPLDGEINNLGYSIVDNSGQVINRNIDLKELAASKKNKLSIGIDDVESIDDSLYFYSRNGSGMFSNDGSDLILGKVILQ